MAGYQAFSRTFGGRTLFYGCVLLVALAPAGCTTLPQYFRNGLKVGPNYTAPPVALAQQWIDADDKRLSKTSDDLSQWWTVFNDPALNELIVAAYQQNLTLREAGFRILQARAQLGIARGELFPQSQFAFGNFTRTASSLERGGNTFLRERYNSLWSYGFGLAWELDFWGRFRRQIESAGANLDASVHDYDDVLVTLLADVAANYVIYRTNEERIRYAQANAKIQEDSARVAEARKGVDPKGELDWDQARALWFQTLATIPELEINLRQSMNRLSILLGIPPTDLTERLQFHPLGSIAPEVIVGIPIHLVRTRIPSAQAEVAVGVPADLLRRRPDVRRAERLAAAQCAQIGVAESDFYPHISLTGSLGFAAEQFKDLFKGTAFNGTFGPSFHWDILNYGRIRNNVRLQDAKFQELLTAYQSSVLTAQREAEDGLVTFLKAQQRAGIQGESATFAVKAEAIVRSRYQLEQPFDYTRVTQTQQLRVQEQDLLAQAQGEVALGLIQVYRALGGGWQIRCGLPASARVPTPAPPTPAREPATLPPPRPVLQFGGPS